MSRRREIAAGWIGMSNHSETSQRQRLLTEARVSTELWASTLRPVIQRPRVRFMSLGPPSAALGGHSNSLVANLMK